VKTTQKHYEVKTWKEVGRHDGEYATEPEDCEHQWEQHDGPDERKFRDCENCGSIEELVTVKVLNRAVTLLKRRRTK
jgi:hypothetical protein